MLIPFLLIFLLLIPRVATAGTEDNPEISDPSGDSLSPYNATDIIKAWFSDDAKFLNYTIELVDIDDIPLNTTVLYDLQFTFDKEYAAVVHLPITNEGIVPRGALSYWEGATAVHIGDLNITYDCDKNQISFQIPKEWIGKPKVGEKLESIYAQTQICITCGVKSGGTWVTWTYVAIPYPVDRAPGQEGNYAKYIFTYSPIVQNQINIPQSQLNTNLPPSSQKVIPGFDMIILAGVVCFIMYIRKRQIQK